MKNIDRAVEITKAAIMEKGISYNGRNEGAGEMLAGKQPRFLKKSKKCLMN